jgi:hypothetical protein
MLDLTSETISFNEACKADQDIFNIVYESRINEQNFTRKSKTDI